MINFNPYILLFIIATIITGFAQVLLKVGANKHKILFLNRQLFLGYSLLFTTTLLTVASLKYISLTMATALLPLSYVFTMLFSFVALNEQVNKRKILSLLIIIIGIIVFSL